jgi:hypothetical protein
MPKPRTLLVYPNPFHALDHEGQPAGVLSYEPTGDGATTFDERRFIGASLQHKMLSIAVQGTAQHSMQRTWFEYLDTPVEVPESPYYTMAIARGEIFAANEETAKRAGITNGYVKPEDLLERAKAEAIDAYERNLPHDDADPLAPDALVKFSFGPMKVATEARKKLEVDAKKLEADQKKIDDDARKAEEEGVKNRAKLRAERDKQNAEDDAARETAAKNEAAAAKVAADAATAAAAAVKKSTPSSFPKGGS